MSKRSTIPGFFRMSRQYFLGGLFLVALSIGGASAIADQLTWRDGRTAEGLLISKQGRIHLQTGENQYLPVQWEELKAVEYSILRGPGDFAVMLEEGLESMEQSDTESLHLVSHLWEAAGCEKNTLAEKDREAFMKNVSWPDRAERLEALLDKLFGIGSEFAAAGRLSEAVDACLLTAWLGYRMQETGFPKRYRLAFRFIDGGLKNLGPLFGAEEDADRDWNVIFGINRLYQAWGIGSPPYPQEFIRAYAEQMHQAGALEELPGEIVFPDSYETISKAYIRQCHVWLAGDLPECEKEVLEQRQSALALDWVRLQKPGIRKEDFLRLGEIDRRQERARSLASIAYLTAEALLFKTMGKRLTPAIQTNVPPPRDPFTGAQYRYLRREPVDIIYSLGPDKTDQEAQVPFVPGSGSLRGDIYLIERDSEQ